MMEFFNLDDAKNAGRLHKLGNESLVKFLNQIFGQHSLGALSSKFANARGTAYIDAVLQVLGVEFTVEEKYLQRIPKTGPVLVVSNHPYGGLDALMLVKMISQVRPDFKMIVNQEFESVEPLAEFMIAARNPEDLRNPANSKKVQQQALKHLADGGAVGIFPAGELASYRLAKNELIDREWSANSIRFVHKAQYPILPVYFKGASSWLLQLLARVHPLVRTMSLPNDLLGIKQRVIPVKIGNLISVADQAAFSDLAQFGRFLRVKTYSLGTKIKPQKFFFPLQLAKPQEPEPIVEPIDATLLADEVAEAMRHYLLFETTEFATICAPASAIPNLLHEIGRLREVTFREVGEGTNLKIDLDEFDLYYLQLVIWDKQAHRIVGAYRIGKGKDILAQYGKNGFYLQSLFRMKRGFVPVLEQAIELGRSFIVKEYQRKPLSLFFLWKGILIFLLKNPEYRYLIGPVSISNSFSKFSKDLLVSFIQSNYYDDRLAALISPRKRFKLGREFFQEKELIVQASQSDFKKLDKYIRDIESDMVTPVLLKKYISLNAKIIGFNTDPKFNDCLDGFIVLDVYDVPMDVLQSLAKEFNDDSLLGRFAQGERAGEG